MSYDLCLWDPSLHPPMPSSRKQAIEIAERIGAALIRMPISEDDPDRVLQTADVVAEAALLGLVVMDDETGVCFLPDGTMYPEEDREMWEWELAQARAPKPDQAAPDNRTFLQTLASELFDALGRGNKHI